MPELPEVQTIVDDLNKKIRGRRITDVWFDTPKMIKKPGSEKPTATTSLAELKSKIKNAKIEKVERRGKNIIINLKLKTKNLILLIHQKMTGHMLVGKWKLVNGKWKSLIRGFLGEKVNDYIHFILYLDNGRQVALSDLRKFAKIMLGEKNEILKTPDIAKIGPEPLDPKFNFSEFKKIINTKSGKIKQVLMDQNIIAGIGNIYSDEMLWVAKIHPFRPAKSLNDSELKKIFNAMKLILKKALKLRGASISDYRDTAGKSGGYDLVRFVYRREGKPCPRCRAPIKRVKMGGRSAHFCPKCQPI